MQFESALSLIVALAGFTSTLIGMGIVWGVMKSKVSKLEEQMDDLEQDLKEVRSSYVPKDHFDSVFETMQDQVTEIQRDIKSILMIVGKNGPSYPLKK